MGIDYGFGKTNIDTETKIRYGIISVNSVLQAWADNSEPFYPCDSCELSEDEKEDGDACSFCEVSSWYIDDDEYFAETCFDNTEIMIMKSPYFTAGAYCSACAPGAVNLDQHENPKTADDIAYCFGHDFFEDGKAPYRVFSVLTGREVFPENEN